MARELGRGDICLYRFGKPDKRRPVVVISREDAIAVLNTVLVAPVTSTIRGLPSEVVIGEEEGLKHPSAINLDHVQCVSKAKLGRYLGTVGVSKLLELCQALRVAAGCAP